MNRGAWWATVHGVSVLVITEWLSTTHAILCGKGTTVYLSTLLLMGVWVISYPWILQIVLL